MEYFRVAFEMRPPPSRLSAASIKIPFATLILPQFLLNPFISTNVIHQQSLQFLLLYSFFPVTFVSSYNTYGLQSSPSLLSLFSDPNQSLS